jgi:hypothetical protein
MEKMCTYVRCTAGDDREDDEVECKTNSGGQDEYRANK